MSIDAGEIQPEVNAKKSYLKWIAALIAVMLIASLGGSLFLWNRSERYRTYFNDIAALYSDLYFHFDSVTVDSFKEKVASGEDFVVVITRPG